MILFTADFLAERYRTFMYHTEGILPVLEAVVRCLDLGPTFVYGRPGPGRAGPAFDPCVFYALSRLRYANDLPPLADAAALSAESLAYLRKFLGNFELVVGYELTDLTAALLDRFGIRYLNIWLHPVRFMEDELFFVTTNDPGYRAGLARHAVSEDSFFVNARYAKAVINRRNRADVKPRSCVFFGQTPNDKTLRKPGGFLNAGDYTRDLRCVAATFPRLYYSRHPLNKSDDEFRILKGNFRDIVRTEANAYRLLSSDAVDLVLTISSSVGAEAYYFGKNVLYLDKPSVDIRRPGGFALDASLFDPGVFADVLGAARPRPGRFMFLPRNKVRNLLDAYYAYPILKDHYDGR